MVDFTDDENFVNALNDKVSLDRVGASKERHVVTSEYLSQKWLISPEAARKTVHHTTQWGIRKILHPPLSRRFKTKDREMKYNRLQHNIFTNTMQTGTVYRIGNIYAQFFKTEFGWSRAHLIKRKVDDHKILFLLFKRDFVPPKMVTDGEKKQNLGSFKRNPKRWIAT